MCLRQTPRPAWTRMKRIRTLHRAVNVRKNALKKIWPRVKTAKTAVTYNLLSKVRKHDRRRNQRQRRHSLRERSSIVKSSRSANTSTTTTMRRECARIAIIPRGGTKWPPSVSTLIASFTPGASARRATSVNTTIDYDLHRKKRHNPKEELKLALIRVVKSGRTEAIHCKSKCQKRCLPHSCKKPSPSNKPTTHNTSKIKFRMITQPTESVDD